MGAVHVLGGRGVEDAGVVVRAVVKMCDHELRHIRGSTADRAGGHKLNNHVVLLLEYTIIIGIRLGDIWCELRWCWLLDRRVVHAKR